MEVLSIAMEANVKQSEGQDVEDYLKEDFFDLLSDGNNTKNCLRQ